MGLPVIGRTELITKRIKTFLEEQEKLLRHITPKYILQKAFGNTEAEKGLVEVFEIFLKTPGLPLLENINVLKEAVINGAKTGILGIKIENEMRNNAIFCISGLSCYVPLKNRTSLSPYTINIIFLSQQGLKIYCPL